MQHDGIIKSFISPITIQKDIINKSVIICIDK